jgi:hypothetical protein
MMLPCLGSAQSRNGRTRCIPLTAAANREVSNVTLVHELDAPRYRRSRGW